MYQMLLPILVALSVGLAVWSLTRIILDFSECRPSQAEKATPQHDA